MRSWLCLVVAACGADSSPAPAPAFAPTLPTAKPVPPRRPAPAAPLAAAHGAEIVALSVTRDGRAAVSADRLGGIRRWTALDGTREPVVIHDTAARAITLARDEDGFTIGTPDAAGGVHVMRTSVLGAVRARVTVASGAGVVAREIDRTERGLLILRADPDARAGG